MSLREEIKQITPVFTTNDDVAYRVCHKLTDESANEYINKVLDAVVEEFNEEADQVVMKGDYDEGIHDAHKIEAPRIINRLRPKS